jgi:toxin ParE1/3/4
VIKRRGVLFSDVALKDMEDICDFIATESGAAIARKIFEDIETRCEHLRDFPDRGNRPKELLELGMTAYRELHYKPYRIIYGITETSVIIHTILDGRRDVKRVLQERLLQEKRS